MRAKNFFSKASKRVRDSLEREIPPICVFFFIILLPFIINNEYLFNIFPRWNTVMTYCEHCLVENVKGEKCINIMVNIREFNGSSFIGDILFRLPEGVYILSNNSERMQNGEVLMRNVTFELDRARSWYYAPAKFYKVKDTIIMISNYTICINQIYIFIYSIGDKIGMYSVGVNMDRRKTRTFLQIYIILDVDKLETALNTFNVAGLVLYASFITSSAVLSVAIVKPRLTTEVAAEVLLAILFGGVTVMLAQPTSSGALIRELQGLLISEFKWFVILYLTSLIALFIVHLIPKKRSNWMTFLTYSAEDIIYQSLPLVSLIILKSIYPTYFILLNNYMKYPYSLACISLQKSFMSPLVTFVLYTLYFYYQEFLLYLASLSKSKTVCRRIKRDIAD